MKTTKILFLLTTSFLSQFTFSQSEIQWQKSLGGTLDDKPFSIEQTSDNGFIIAGSTISYDVDVSGFHGGNGTDAWIVKTDSLGVIQWQKCYGGTEIEVAYDIIETSDGGYIFTGQASSIDGDVTSFHGGTGSDIWVVKINAVGDIIWQKCLGGTNVDIAYSIIELDQSGYLLSGSTWSNDGDVIGFNGGNEADGWIIKIDSIGVIEWQKCLGGTSFDAINSLQQTNDQGFILSGRTNSNDGDVSGNHGNLDSWVVKVDSVGNIEWQKCLGGTGIEFSTEVQEDSNGGYIVMNTTQYSNNGDVSGYLSVETGATDIWVVKLSNIGVWEWQKCLGGASFDYGVGLEQTQDAGYLIAGTTSYSQGINSQDYYVVKLDNLGSFDWHKSLGGSSEDVATCIKLTNDNEYIIVGNSASNDGDITNINGGTDYWVVKMGMVSVQGNVYFDFNTNCSMDSTEFGIEGINLVVNPGNIVVTTNEFGKWKINYLAPGNYTITVDTTTINWSSSCSNTASFSITDSYMFEQGPSFGLINSNPCSDPNISINAPFLRPCLPDQLIYVSACNQITATGMLPDSYVDVELDPLITVTNSSWSFVPLGNNVYRFQTGDLNPGQCVSFTIASTISSPLLGCSDLLGLTLCMEANLYPVEPCSLDTLPSPQVGLDGNGVLLSGFPQPCNLPWDQSSLSVDGWCQGDSIYFSITNTGQPVFGDMECYSPIWITVDGVVTYSDSIIIPGGETVLLSYLGNGQTWILNVEQHPLHPGNSHPNAHVEACGDLTNWTSDLVNDFPQDDADPSVDIYCGVVTGSYDPNDKTGYPFGETNQNFIQPNQQMQYVIRFQNTGSDTAFTVVIRDTLDIDLNIFTVTSGTSSHSYEFKMYGPRVLEWTFNNINLPDSSTNQESSKGFVSFTVNQVPNLAPTTEIKNTAAIYFDFNDPIITNTTTHRIFEGFVNVLNIEEISQQGKKLLVYPNPTSTSITIMGEKDMNQSFSIYDQIGREVFSGRLNGISTVVQLSNFNKGMYILKVEGNFQPSQIIIE